MGVLIEKLRRSKFLNRMLVILGKDSFAGSLIIRAPYLYYRVFPDKRVKEARVYFRDNKDQVIRNLRILADKKSRDVYKNLIRFRMTMKYRYQPGMELPQYFPADIVKISENEVFLDVGGYDGDSSVEFLKQCDGKYKKVIIFEPDKACIEMIKNNPKIPVVDFSIIEKGAWNRETTLGFIASGDSASRIVENSSDSNCIPVTAIDLCEECKDATFIKMDIEGAEMKALEGAKETISRNKPKLAISIYHSDSDMVDIINYIHNLVPEYKVYVRHHSTGLIDTVAYFV